MRTAPGTYEVDERLLQEVGEPPGLTRAPLRDLQAGAAAQHTSHDSGDEGRAYESALGN